MEIVVNLYYVWWFLCIVNEQCWTTSVRPYPGRRPPPKHKRRSTLFSCRHNARVNNNTVHLEIVFNQGANVFARLEECQVEAGIEEITTWYRQFCFAHHVLLARQCATISRTPCRHVSACLSFALLCMPTDTVTRWSDGLCLHVTRHTSSVFGEYTTERLFRLTTWIFAYAFLWCVEFVFV